MDFVNNRTSSCNRNNGEFAFEYLDTNDPFFVNTGASWYALYSPKGQILYAHCHAIESEAYCDIEGNTENPEITTRKIAVVLNSKLKQSSFEVDDIDKGVAFEHIRDYGDPSYRIAVTLQDPGDKVELLQFEQF